VHAICKARRVLRLACTLFARRTRICIWRVRYLQSASGFAFGACAICKARQVCIWRARYLQSAPGFAFGVHAICKARPDLHLARTLFAKPARICIWRARYLQSAPGFAFRVCAICKARPDLHLACAPRSRRVSIAHHQTKRKKSSSGNTLLLLIVPAVSIHTARFSFVRFRFSRDVESMG